jgi:hypothetical protein
VEGAAIGVPLNDSFYMYRLLASSKDEVQRYFLMPVRGDSEFEKGDGRMIPSTLENYIFSEIGAPKIITSNLQLKEYVTALLELDQRSHLTVAEQNFAELLIILIEAYYVEKPRSHRSDSHAEFLQEVL